MAMSVAVAGQTAESPKIDTKHLQIVTSSTETGGRRALVVDITPKPTMHVYAPGQKDYIPVSLAIDPNPSAKLSAPRFPKGEKYFFKGLNEAQLVYSKPFRIVQDITLAPGASQGPLTIKGTLRYQACDESICYLPVNVPVTWTIPNR